MICKCILWLPAAVALISIANQFVGKAMGLTCSKRAALPTPAPPVAVAAPVPVAAPAPGVVPPPDDDEPPELTSDDEPPRYYTFSQIQKHENAKATERTQAYVDKCKANGGTWVQWDFQAEREEYLVKPKREKSIF